MTHINLKKKKDQKTNLAFLTTVRFLCRGIPVLKTYFSVKQYSFVAELCFTLYPTERLH